MTRHVVNSDRVYHLWAHQSQDEARNGTGSVSFRGPDAYSYGTVIGRIVTNDAGERAYLVSDRSYSVTTSGHQSMLRQAIPDGVPVFHVNAIDSIGWDYHVDTSHAGRLTDYQRRIAEAEGKAKRARLEHTRAWHQRRAIELMQEANAYAQFFGLAEQFDAGLIARLRHEQQEAEARAEVQSRERQARRDAIQREQLAARAALWRNGENVPMWGYPDTLLRVGVEDGEQVVQTSRGAAVPLRHARRLFDAWRASNAKEGDRVGLYTVARVDGDEAIQIGCHYITRTEADRLAASQGWITAEMPSSPEVAA